MHICVSKLTITDSDNGLSPSRRQAIIWSSDGEFTDQCIYASLGLIDLIYGEKITDVLLYL